MADRATGVGRRGIQRVLVDAVFGYDYFISYAWSDGRSYAVALAQALEDEGFVCFLDSREYAKGTNWRASGRRALRKTSRLLVVATRGAIESEPVRFEVTQFLTRRREVIPVDVGGALREPSDLLDLIGPDRLRIDEVVGALRQGPSQEVLDGLRQSFRLVRQDVKRMRVFAVIAAVLALMTVLASFFYWRSETERRAAEKARDRAALRAAIADSRRLALQAAKIRETDGELALLLAEEAVRRHPSPEAMTELTGVLDTASLHAQLEDGHRAARTLHWRPDGSLLATAGSDGFVRLWNADGELVRRWRAHDEPVATIRWKEDGTKLVTASSDGRARVWDEGGRELALLGHESAVEGAFWEPSGDQVLTFTSHGLVLVWATDGTRRVQARHPGVLITGVAWHPRGGSFLVADTGGSAVHYDGAGKRVLKVSPSDSADSSCHHVTWIGRGRAFLTSGSHGVDLWGLDGRRLLHVSDGRTLTSAVDPDGSLLVTCGQDGSSFWRLLARRVSERGEPPTLEWSAEHVRSVRSTGPPSISPGGGVCLLMSKRGARLFGRNGLPRAKLSAPGGKPRCGLWRPDGSVVVTAHGDVARLWSHAAKFTHEAQSTRLPKRLGRWHPRGDLYLVDRRGGVDALDAARAVVSHLPGVGQLGEPVAWHPIEPLVAASETTGEVRVWDISSGEFEEALRHRLSAAFLQWDFAGTALLAAWSDGRLRVWSRARKDLLWGQDLAPINHVDLAPDGRRALVRTQEGKVFLVEDDGERVELEVGARALAVSRWCAPTGELALGMNDGTVLLMGRDGKVSVIPCHDAKVSALDWNPDGSLLLTGAADGEAAILDARGDVVRTLPHQDAIYHVAWSPSGDRFVTATLEASWPRESGPAKVWTMGGALLLRLDGHVDTVEPAIWRPDGSALIALARQGGAPRRWPLTKDGLLARARQARTRELTARERALYLDLGVDSD